MSQFPGTRVHNVRPTSYPLFAWRWLIRFMEEPLTRRWHFGSPVGCVVVFFGSESNGFNGVLRSEGILAFMNINNMSLGTLDPLHVYVKHDVELMSIQFEDVLGCVKFCPGGAAAGACDTAACEFSGCRRGALRGDRL